MTSPPLPAVGDLLARDTVLYPITELRESLDGPLVVATADLPDLMPQQVILKASDCRPAGMAGDLRIWRT